jgi:DNA-binding NtrC family response regulator
VDHGLPDGKGFNMIPKFRNKYPKATIVAMTGQRKAELKKFPEIKGKFHFMEKPFQFVELLKIIKTAV